MFKKFGLTIGVSLVSALSTQAQSRVQVATPSEADEATAARELIRQRTSASTQLLPQPRSSLASQPASEKGAWQTFGQSVGPPVRPVDEQNPVLAGLKVIEPAFQEGLQGMREGLNQIAPLFGAQPQVSRYQTSRRPSYVDSVQISRPAQSAVPPRNGSYSLYDAVRTGSINRVRALLAARVDPDQPSATGWTPLMSAAYYGDGRSVRLLLAAGANPRLRTVRGETALSVALKRGHYNVANLLR